MQGGKSARRSDAVATFESDPNMRVFLLSLSAGAQGLTLNQGAPLKFVGSILEEGSPVFAASDMTRCRLPPHQGSSPVCLLCCMLMLGCCVRPQASVLHLVLALPAKHRTCK